MNKRKISRVMSAFLAFVFVLSIMSAGTFAAETVVSSKNAALNQLMNDIAEGYINDGGEWVVLDMAAFGALKPDSPHKTGEEALQGYINYSIGILNDSAKIQGSPYSAYAKAEIILSAIGGDTNRLYPLNSNSPIKISEKLKAADISQANFYDVPWILLADLQGNLNLSKGEADALIEIIKAEQPESGVFGYTWDGEFYTDPDTTATLITALSAHYNTNPDAKGVVDKAVAGLSREQGEFGSFGNLNSDSMVSIALASMGIDPETDARFVKHGISLYDALLAFSDSGSGTEGAVFWHFMEANPLEMEQGFRAVIALTQMQKTGKAFNIYDFSHVEKQPLRATGIGEIAPISQPTGEGDIEVTFSLKADGEYWINNTKLIIRQGSSVYHAFVKALEEGFEYRGAENGYVRSITNSHTGKTLSEFDQGIDSGWLFKVNGEVPEKGFPDCFLNNGDDIVWFFTDDYIRDTDKAQAAENKAKISFDDVSADHWAYSAIMEAVERNIVSGTHENNFEPGKNVTKAEFAAMLYNLSGGEKVTSSHIFSDVAETDWFYNQAMWMVEKNIDIEASADEFAPNKHLSRQDAVVMLHKYLISNEYSFEGEGIFAGYSDWHLTAEYAKNALVQMQHEGFAVGMANGSFNPTGEISRAEAVSIIIRVMNRLGK